MTNPDQVVAARADLVVRATSLIERTERFIMAVQADEPVGAMNTPTELSRLRRAQLAMRDVEHYLRVLEAVYERRQEDEEDEDGEDSSE